MGISFNAASLLSGSGIDVSQLVSEIQAGQSGQLTVWKADQATLQTQATTIGNINSDLSSLLSASQALSDPTGALTGLTATSSESAVLTASVQAGATAASYNVLVSGLASTGTLYTAAIANASTSILPDGQTTGDLQVQIGGTGGTLADIPITAGVNDTLTTLAQSINSLSTQNSWGITATVVTDANGSRLALYSQASGSPGALAVGANNTTTLSFEPPVGGPNSLFTINGIPYSTTTNTVTGCHPRPDFKPARRRFGAAGAGDGRPQRGRHHYAVTNFVNAYNTVISDINSQFAFNPTTNSQGTLGSDNSLHVLQTSLLSALTYATTDPTSVSNGLSIWRRSGST